MREKAPHRHLQLMFRNHHIIPYTNSQAGKEISLKSPIVDTPDNSAFPEKRILFSPAEATLIPRLKQSSFPCRSSSHSPAEAILFSLPKQMSSQYLPTGGITSSGSGQLYFPPFLRSVSDFAASISPGCCIIRIQLRAIAFAAVFRPL